MRKRKQASALMAEACLRPLEGRKPIGDKLRCKPLSEQDIRPSGAPSSRRLPTTRAYRVKRRGSLDRPCDRKYHRAAPGLHYLICGSELRVPATLISHLVDILIYENGLSPLWGSHEIWRDENVHSYNLYTSNHSNTGTGPGSNFSLTFR